MIIKYDKNNKKLKKSVNFDLQDALKIDAKVFLNNINTINNKKLKAKQSNYNKKCITINIDYELPLAKNISKYYPKWFTPSLPNYILEDLKKLYKEIDEWY